MEDNNNSTIVKKTAEQNSMQNKPYAERENNNVIVEKTVISKSGKNNLKARRLVMYFAGLIGVLLFTRFLLRLFAANFDNVFVKVIYGITKIFLWPFVGIFKAESLTDLDPNSVFEPITILAIFIYALIGWGISCLIGILKSNRDN